MAMIVYKDSKTKPKNSWVKYFLGRIKQNKNNLVAIVGSTGSGKTWSAISICEMMSKENGVYFGVENIVFTLKKLMELINSKNLKKGSCIIFDEPQISISSREFQSEANKIFNYLITTFRHRNLTLFFCTPYEDLLDLSTRKLFHAKFLTLSIDTNKGKVILKPMTIEYNSHNRKFYEKFLRVVYKEDEDKDEYSKRILKSWGVPKPSKELIKVYEEKKLEFTTNLNKNIEERLNHYEQSQKEKYKVKDTRKPLTDKQKDVLIALSKHSGDVKQVSKELGIGERIVYFHLKQARKKDYDWSEFNKGSA